MVTTTQPLLQFASSRQFVAWNPLLFLAGLAHERSLHTRFTYLIWRAPSPSPVQLFYVWGREKVHERLQAVLHLSHYTVVGEKRI